VFLRVSLGQVGRLSVPLQGRLPQLLHVLSHDQAPLQ
jgi:hypothetical protein